MKTQLKVIGFMLVFVLTSIVSADTFTHQSDGTSFTGFATQKSTAEKTLVFNHDENKMIPVVLSDFDITYNTLGRRDYVVLIRVTQPDILLSKAVSEKVAASVIHASNTGPQAIIIQIDNPGGRGDYMKIIATALSDTTNCPVVAYISGGTYGGAFSASAILAMACDQIFIHPNASMGAVGQYGAQGRYTDYLLTFSSDSLVSYTTYATSLAQKHNRPPLLVKALIDKRLSVVEVADIDGSRKYISKQDRQPTQTLVRTLTEGMSIPVSTTDSTAVISAADVVGKVLSLTAKDTIELGLANRTAENVSEILVEMGIAEVTIRPDKGINNIIKKYQAGRRNIQQGLLRIEQLEEQVSTYSEQFTTMDNQLRSSTQSREVAQESGVVVRRSGDDLRLGSNYNYYYDQESNMTDRDRRTSGNVERITREEPVMNIGIVYDQLTLSLQDLIAGYRRVLNLAKRWPGGLPPELTVQMLQDNMDSASNDLDKLYRYRPIYPTAVQQYPTSNRRRR